MNVVTRFKAEPVKDRAWLNHLRTQPCIVTGVAGESEAAHLRLNGAGGTGKKPPDNQAVSLHWRLHRVQSTAGEGKSWLLWTRRYPEFAPRLAEKYPELFYRWLISVAEAEHDEWMRMP